MYAGENRLPVIEIVAALTQVEIENVDGIHLLHLVVFVANLDVLCDGLRYSIEHTSQVIELTCQLDLHDDDVTTLVFRLYIDPIELVHSTFLITFTLQDLGNCHLFSRKDRDQSLQHGEVGLVTQHTLHRPIKSNIFVAHFHDVLYSFIPHSKVGTLIESAKSSADYLKHFFGVFKP